MYQSCLRRLQSLSIAPKGKDIEQSDGVTHGSDFLAQTVQPAIERGIFVVATVHSVKEHVEAAHEARHPEEGWGLTGRSPASLLAAAAQIAKWGLDTSSKQKRRMFQLEEIARELQPLSKTLRREFSPRHIQEAMQPHIHVAFLSALAEAFDLDARTAADAVLGHHVVGEHTSVGSLQISAASGRGRGSGRVTG